MAVTDPFSKPRALRRRMRPLLALAVLALCAAGCGPAADAASAIDRALVRIEQVRARLSGIPAAVKDVVKAATADGASNTADAEAMLEKAVRSSFDADVASAEILEALERVGGETVDAGAFARAADAFEDARAKVAHIYETQDRTAAKDIEAHLADAEYGQRIRELTERMAAPDLAVETAFTAQLMYRAVEAFSGAGTAALASAPEEKRKADTQEAIAALRSSNENEKPVPKQVARLDEQARLSFILAALPSEDLSVLSDFYQSAGGKAKRQALVDSYTQLANQANTRMLQDYFSALADHLKTHPRPQQQ